MAVLISKNLIFIFYNKHVSMKRIPIRIIVHLHVCRLGRWTQTLKELGEQRIQLMGDCLLSSAFLCYVGAFTWDFRNQLVYTDWQADLRDRQVPMSQPFRLEAVLTDDVEISKYGPGWAGCKNGSGCLLMPRWIQWSAGVTLVFARELS